MARHTTGFSKYQYPQLICAPLALEGPTHKMFENVFMPRCTRHYAVIVWPPISLCCLFLYCIYIKLHIYSPITRKRSMRCASLLRSCRPSVYHAKMGESRQVPFPTAQHVNLPTCSSHCPFNAERQAGKL